MPISSAAISMSRTAIHMRPMRPCTRLEASQVIAMTIAEHDEIARRIGVAVAPVTGMPNSVRVGTSIAPEAL